MKDNVKWWIVLSFIWLLILSGFFFVGYNKHEYQLSDMSDIGKYLEMQGIELPIRIEVRSKYDYQHNDIIFQIKSYDLPNQKSRDIFQVVWVEKDSL